jgi:hypothetical protein
MQEQPTVNTVATGLWVPCKEVKRQAIDQCAKRRTTRVTCQHVTTGWNTIRSSYYCSTTYLRIGRFCNNQIFLVAVPGLFGGLVDMCRPLYLMEIGPIGRLLVSHCTATRTRRLALFVFACRRLLPVELSFLFSRVNFPRWSCSLIEIPSSDGALHRLPVTIDNATPPCDFRLFSAGCGALKSSTSILHPTPAVHRYLRAPTEHRHYGSLTGSS